MLDHDDLIENIGGSFRSLTKEETVKEVCRYFYENMKPIFPAKSYSVAIIYARLIEKYFQENFLDVLNDSELFLGTDKYFVPYLNSKDIYDEVLDFLSMNCLNEFEESDILQVQKTVQYFYKEFMIEKGE